MSVLSSRHEEQIDKVYFRVDSGYGTGCFGWNLCMGAVLSNKVM